jgi:hypothetical protein
MAIVFKRKPRPEGKKADKIQLYSLLSICDEDGDIAWYVPYQLPLYEADDHSVEVDLTEPFKKFIEWYNYTANSPDEENSTFTINSLENGKKGLVVVKRSKIHEFSIAGTYQLIPVDLREHVLNLQKGKEE